MAIVKTAATLLMHAWARPWFSIEIADLTLQHEQPGAMVDRKMVDSKRGLRVGQLLIGSNLCRIKSTIMQ